MCLCIEQQLDELKQRPYFHRENSGQSYSLVVENIINVWLIKTWHIFLLKYSFLFKYFSYFILLMGWGGAGGG